MPGLEPDTERIFILVTKLYISDIFKFFENIGIGKFLGEIGCSEAHLAYIEISNTVKRVARRRQ